jgi:hypothetical protein
MAHPFTSVPIGFSVMGKRHLLWEAAPGTSLAIPHLLEKEPARSGVFPTEDGQLIEPSQSVTDHGVEGRGPHFPNVAGPATRPCLLLWQFGSRKGEAGGDGRSRWRAAVAVRA